MNSVTIAVQYSTVEEENTPPASPNLIDDTGFIARAWRANHGENSICLGLSDKSITSLVGTKCTAPGNENSNFQHRSRCFENLVQMMETANPRTVLQQLYTLGNASSNPVKNLEYQLWISTLLESRTLNQSRGSRPSNDQFCSNSRPEILELNGSIGM
jgi:hypothetical protein